MNTWTTKLRRAGRDPARAADSPSPGTVRPPARPRFLPREPWARWALLFLLVFTLLRGGIWAMTTPAFWGPDEDYHFNYVEYITTQGAIIDPDKPTYPREYPAVAAATLYDSYGQGPRTRFAGDPKRSVRRLGELPRSAREPVLQGRGAGVVHPPLYHSAGALVNWALGDASVLTRIAAVRWVTALFGVLAVFFAWLLAAQALRQAALQLLVAFLVAVQPMIGFLSGIVNHDMALIAFFTAALASMLFVMRAAPTARQGIWLGVPVALALLVKSSALALVPLAALTYLAQWLVNDQARREVVRSAALAAGIVAVVAGWWYLYSLAAYGSVTGALGPVVDGSTAAAGEPATIGNVISLAREWTGLTYRTYWFHFLFFEAPRGASYYFVPAFVGVLAMLGLGAFAWDRRRDLLSKTQPELRQVLLLVTAGFAVYLPFMVTDVLRRLNGQTFYLNGGRYLLPAYAAVATLAVIGIRRLVRPELGPWALGLLAAFAGWLSWKVWVFYVHRYFGDAGWGELFRRMSFDRPEFVTPTTYRIAFAVLVLSLVAAVGAVVRGTIWPDRRIPWRRVARWPGADRRHGKIAPAKR